MFNISSSADLSVPLKAIKEESEAASFLSPLVLTSMQNLSVTRLSLFYCVKVLLRYLDGLEGSTVTPLFLSPALHSSRGQHRAVAAPAGPRPAASFPGGQEPAAAV